MSNTAVLVISFDPEAGGDPMELAHRLRGHLPDGMTAWAAVKEPAAHVQQVVDDLTRGRFTPAEPAATRSETEIRVEIKNCEERLTGNRPKYVQHHLSARIEALQWALGAPSIADELAEPRIGGEADALAMRYRPDKPEVTP